MKRIGFVIAVCLAITGCKSLKEQQHGAFVGDSQTKVYYKNVGGAIDKVPEANRVFFRSTDEAAEKGYTSSSEGTEGSSTPSEE